MPSLLPQTPQHKPSTSPQMSTTVSFKFDTTIIYMYGYFDFDVGQWSSTF